MAAGAKGGPPRGTDVFFDMRRRLPGAGMEIIFDVGAHVGQSTERFVEQFPGAAVWSFEPASECYAVLAHKFAKIRSVRCERLALGAATGEIELALATQTSMNHIATHSANLPERVAVTGRETVAMTTLDAYCGRNAIPRIDFLKIDTEGFDLEVLRGATALFSRGAISFVQCECGLNPENRFHTPLAAIQQFLEDQGYRLFGFYTQAEEWTTGAPHLRRVDAVFISPAIIRQGRR